MFPIIDKRKTGINIRRIMDMRGLTVKDVQEYLDAEDFRHITDFNQLKVIGHLGSSVNEISRPVLMQIGRYVLNDLEKI